MQPLQPEDEFLLLASDGLWQLLDSQVWVRVIPVVTPTSPTLTPHPHPDPDSLPGLSTSPGPYPQPQWPSQRRCGLARADLRAHADAGMAAEKLVEASLATGRADDNITAMVVLLRPIAPTPARQRPRLPFMKRAASVPAALSVAALSLSEATASAGVVPALPG